LRYFIASSCLDGRPPTEVDNFKLAWLDILPVDVGEVQISMKIFGILASLDFSLLLEGAIFEHLESLLRKIRHGHYLSPTQPVLSLWAALASEKCEKTHILSELRLGGASSFA
jgi:hypothetical protein